MGALTGPDFPTEIGLAVSGGGDSMAMLHLAAGWARVWGIGLRVVTVDHGLRPAAAAEAAMVADEAAGLGLPHDILRWEWDGQGNLMDAARRARLDLIGEWRGTVRHVCFGHTSDDVAETFLLRLKRGSGVEGLAAMPASRHIGEWLVLRPLLEVSRAELRHYLKVLRIPYAEDPTNSDPAYDRARIRALLDPLEAEGLGRETLVATARRLARAREALTARALSVLTEVEVSMPPTSAAGAVVWDRDRFAAVETDTQMRCLAAALQYVAQAEYRPRASALEDALDRILSGGTITLHGCQAMARGGRLLVFREYAAVRDLRETAGPESLWDGRWRISGPEINDLEIRALGPEGLRQAAPEDRAGCPAALLHALPSVWDGDRLVACAALGHGPAHRAELCSARPGGQRGVAGWLQSH
ncbi:tRNA lysidine(34) synthetase TilS [Histidinibacterium aquaticum]|uniref:tRNA(Ile)-lysidine synthase n=2 Tax=Histidinibacterium aquaticum TaxID=2613962 RepID=A0A5J5GR84_9RHOB|nr:tRNA lysidine(34) synthetase TilS [Histidinibacterium aquaticum]